MGSKKKLGKQMGEQNSSNMSELNLRIYIYIYDMY